MQIARDLLGRALERPARAFDGRAADGQAGPNRDDQLVEAPLPARALRPQLGDAALESIHRGESRVPAVAQLGDPPQRARGMAADPDRDVAPTRLGVGADVAEGKEPAAIARPSLAPALAHDPDRLVGPGAALVEGAAEELDLLAHPAHAGAEDDPPVGEMIERRQHL